MFYAREFFAHVTQADLTGEQLRVLCCLLSREADGEIGLRQNQVADTLGITESNVSRSIKALKEAAGYDGKPVLQIEKVFC